MKAYRYVTAEAAETFVTSYNSGLSIRAIMKATGYSYGCVHRFLSDSPRVVLRSRGCRNTTRGVGKRKGG